MRIFGLGTETFAQLDLSAAPTVLQKIWWIEDIIHWSIQIETTGTITATLVIEADNRYMVDPAMHGQAQNVGAWIDITAQLTPAVVAPAGAVTKQIVRPTVTLPVRAVRATMTRTAGAGTAFMCLVGKGL